jgi:hypothetical protein
MTRSEAKIPPWDVGASNKHGPPVFRPPKARLHIRGKPPNRDPAGSRAPNRNKGPASHLKLVLVIRPPSLLWERTVRPPTESQTAHCIVTGNNYWESDRPPDNEELHRCQQIQSFGLRTGEVWGRERVRG